MQRDGPASTGAGASVPASPALPPAPVPELPPDELPPAPVPALPSDEFPPDEFPPDELPPDEFPPDELPPDEFPPDPPGDCEPEPQPIASSRMNRAVRRMGVRLRGSASAYKPRSLAFAQNWWLP